MPSAIASKVPGAQGDRYKCRLLEFFAKSLQASIETRYNEGFFGLRLRIYYQQQSLRYLVPRVTSNMIPNYLVLNQTFKSVTEFKILYMGRFLCFVTLS